MIQKMVKDGGTLLLRSLIPDPRAVMHDVQSRIVIKSQRLKTCVGATHSIVCPLRRKLVNDILTEFMEVIESTVSELNKNTLKKMQEAELGAFWEIKIGMIFDTLKIRILLLGIPEAAFQIFSTKYSYLAEELSGEVAKIIKSDFMYHSNTEKLDAILNSIYNLMDRIVYIAKSSVNDLNGELTKIMDDSTSKYKCTKCSIDNCKYK